jgi:hypothetical protein
VATADELFAWIKQTVLAQTCLPEDAAELIPFWVVSTWFQDVMTILPCLVITGPAYEAGVILHLLRDFLPGGGAPQRIPAGRPWRTPLLDQSGFRAQP